ncbi:hypothetical protein C343_06317 [Cryptococcus neoformans C23]|uniref:DNA polymerase epsilon subunit D n=1 Tax=Cryptococcus neoformans (strain H99 / ATCC 208821 / CBS 10515 / FGSC 9487) TaxID=235443 RepID=J9W2I2_CRYN9|nr:hypothetical protein CNAG_07904 [Cryptococcus neoformans var. grubii H99]AFR98340.2 hypothetical protein CNAG_07904 [Cryptococcus neoformans var. grubii H99]AUB28471.1 hypothetical protein CKF44_07904 [Cryptococcus neoformans var. grubii]OWZ27147.1 hypothetical protein C347_06317 [Cryptococcus neoformans var. grubii AD2-60a]OWZ39109.1 hypothetical protein C343_06317 [Cryptococcus neoformans var. grubii C23]|eukprot:XP_012053005.1 hypothetical protein CNAG_07904 [Cryptococcus neoformans var. grubii H99]
MPPKGSTIHPPKPPADAPPTAASIQMKANSVGMGEYELPKTTLTKLAKGSIPDNVKMQQDVVLALLRGSTLFISYLTAAAHDQAIARSGRTVTAADVIKAITEMDFGPADALVPIMEQELAAFRNIQQRAKAAKKPPGPGRGRGARKSAASTRAGEDVDMAETEGEVDAGEGGVDEGDEEEEEQEQEQEEGDEVDGEDGLVAGEQDEA